jgi:hypothetical protein
MNQRKLAALLATTTVAATPTLITARAAHADAAPPTTLHLDTGLDHMPPTQCQLSPPAFDPNPMNGKPALIAEATGYKGGFCPDGSVTLLYSGDHLHWKSMGTGAVREGEGGVEVNPWHGNFWYQSYYVAADGTSWGSTDSTSPVRIDC